MQAYEGAAQIIMAGTDSVLRAMESYTKQAWVLRAWQDVFVDLVQGQLQHLYISLLSSEPPPAVLCNLGNPIALRSIILGWLGFPDLHECYHNVHVGSLLYVRSRQCTFDSFLSG